MLRYLTAGESHGRSLVTIVEGMPSGLKLDEDLINKDLARRQKGYGRSARMKIERDEVEIISGVKAGMSLGSPITLIVHNKDFSIERLPVVTLPRPGHADLAGMMKYDFKDARCVLERASARETTARVAAGGLSKLLLNEFNIEIISHVTGIGCAQSSGKGLSFSEIKNRAQRSPVSCADKKSEAGMINAIDEAKRKGDTLGGVFEVIIKGAPAGLGSYVEYDLRLDGLLAQAVMSIQAVKGVEIGNGIRMSGAFGSQFHDEIFYSKNKGFFRKRNNAGGLEGGITNGEMVVVHGYMKPIATLSSALRSVETRTKKASIASVERHDICAVPACAVVAEAACAFEIAKAMREKFGGDSLREMKRNYVGYLNQIDKL